MLPMDTDIRYLELIERDLQQVAARGSARVLRRRSAPVRASAGTPAAAAVSGVLVVAGLIGWLVTGGVGSSNQRGRVENAAPAARSPPRLRTPPFPAPGCGTKKEGPVRVHPEQRAPAAAPSTTTPARRR